MAPLLNKVKSAGTSIANKLTTENMRKYVWYDYSIVEKAHIQIIISRPTIGTVVPGTNNDLVADGPPLPVQINPSSFSFSYHTNLNTKNQKLLGSDENLAKKRVLQAFGDVDRASIEIPLMFDIYDEYNARTMDGTMTKDFSLSNYKATSLPTLIEHAKNGNRYAMFVWGDIKKFGLLTGINVTYTAFSPWGQALKAEATLELSEQNVDVKNLVIDGGYSTNVSTGKKVLSGIKNIFR